jgi:hypothetical protein
LANRDVLETLSLAVDVGSRADLAAGTIEGSVRDVKSECRGYTFYLRFAGSVRGLLIKLPSKVKVFEDAETMGDILTRGKTLHIKIWTV